MHSAYHQPLRIVTVQGSREHVIRCASKALSHQTDEQARKLREFLPGVTVDTHAPTLFRQEGSTFWSSWHYGGHFQFFAVGLTDLMMACDLTENERESLILQTRRASVHNEKVSLVVSGKLKEQPHSVPTHSLTCNGLLFIRT